MSFTTIETAMLKVLQDGKPHMRRELHACLNDELGPQSNIYPHLSSIRRKIRPRDDIVCETVNGDTYYRYATNVASLYPPFSS